MNARKTLLAGFTTVRDVGSEDFLDVGLRNTINAGVVPGPRMLVAVHALGATGGHCDDGAGFRFGLLNHEMGPEDGVINSPDQARFAVRFNIKYGADVIKTCATGGVLSPTDDVDVPQLSQAELDAIVGAAHELRRKTAAHAHGAEGAKRAIRAGIDSIEHGTFLDEEAMRMMRERGTYLVPTLAYAQRARGIEISVGGAKESRSRRESAGRNGAACSADGSQDRPRHGCGGVPAWEQRTGVRPDGGGRHDAGSILARRAHRPPPICWAWPTRSVRSHQASWPMS